MGIIVDRRKINLNTDVSVNHYIARLKRINNKEKVKTIDGYDTAKFLNLEEPGFMFDRRTGIFNLVTCGNDKWMRDDKITQDEWEQFMSYIKGIGGDDDDDASEDDFTWTDLEQYVLEGLFNNLSLPNLTKKSFISEEREIIRSGYSMSGGNIDVVKTFFNSVARRMALKNPLEQKIKKLQENNPDDQTIPSLKKQLKSIPFIDDMDIRCRRFEEKITPSKRMVMFLLLDISGSMGREEKNLAKLFAKLVVTFLSSKYDKCAIEYIIFNENAYHVDRQEFYYGKKSGGNMLYTALDLEKKIIEEKYTKDWNIYSMIFSDTGMYGSDLDYSIARLVDLLPLHQYLMYINIHDNYVDILEDLVAPFKDNPALGYCTVGNDEDILPSFIELFSKE